MPCPHDPCPDLVDPCPEIWVPFLWKKKAPAATYPQVQGFQKYGGHFSEKKRRLRQRSQPLRASTNLGAIFRQFTIHPHPCGTPRVRLVGQPRFACLSEQYVNGTAGAMPIMNRTESISTSCDSLAFPVALVSNANGNNPLLEQQSSCVHVLSQNPKWRVANWFPYGFKAS